MHIAIYTTHVHIVHSFSTQVRAAAWALEHDTSVVITNGFQENAILNVVNGKKIGTFFTPVKAHSTPVEIQASKGRFIEM